MGDDHQDYYKYLSKRSHLALCYRRFYLYPNLAKFLYGKVLDFGCGLGDFLAFRPNTIGVDINPIVIQYCQERGLKAYLIQSLPLDFENESFQGVVLDNVLEHMDRPAPVIEEITRVLEEKGTLIIGVPGEKGFASDNDHKRFYDESALKELIIPYGFKWRRTLYMPLRILNFEHKLRQYCIYGIFQNSP